MSPVRGCGRDPDADLAVVSLARSASMRSEHDVEPECPVASEVLASLCYQVLTGRAAPRRLAISRKGCRNDMRKALLVLEARPVALRQGVERRRRQVHAV